MIRNMGAKNPLLQSIVDETGNTSSKDWVYKTKVSIIPTLLSKEIKLAIESKSIHHAESKCHNESAHNHLGKIDSALYVVLGKFSFN